MIHQRVKLGLSAAGLLLAIAAIALDDQRLTWVAIGALTVSVAMRFWGRKKDEEPPPPPSA